MSKGERTRAAILDEALVLASTDGLGGLTIGVLADRLGMSKSGLFAHFGSKEQMQQAVLEAAAERFTAKAIRPALEQPRGLPRVEAFFTNWLDWVKHGWDQGSCPLEAAAVELDDKPGPLRDYVVGTQERMRQLMVDLVAKAKEMGHLRADLDVDAFVFEASAIVYGFSHTHRLFRQMESERLARRSLAQLIERSRPSTAS